MKHLGKTKALDLLAVTMEKVTKVAQEQTKLEERQTEQVYVMGKLAIIEL